MHRAECGAGVNPCGRGSLSVRSGRSSSAGTRTRGQAGAPGQTAIRGDDRRRRQPHPVEHPTAGRPGRPRSAGGIDVDAVHSHATDNGTGDAGWRSLRSRCQTSRDCGLRKLPRRCRAVPGCRAPGRTRRPRRAARRAHGRRQRQGDPGGWARPGPRRNSPRIGSRMAGSATAMPTGARLPGREDELAGNGEIRVRAGVRGRWGGRRTGPGDERDGGTPTTATTMTPTARAARCGRCGTWSVVLGGW